MNGVTTAILLYIFLAVAFPSLAKNKPQFYGALAAVFVIIFLDAISHVAHSDAFSAFTYFMAAMMQIGAVVLLVLSSGGLSVTDFKKEIGDVIEVVRRGESEKEVIIPLRGPQPTGSEARGEAPKKVYKIDDPPSPAVAKPPAKSDPDSHGPLPLS
jgi:hypothetical protein